MMFGVLLSRPLVKHKVPLQARDREAGLTLVEFVVAVIVFGILAVVLLDRVRYYQEVAEKAVMEITIMNIRTGLRYRVAELMLHDRMGELADIERQNPVKWLATPPPNYLGEMRDYNIEEISPGNWFFDTGRRMLVYRVNSGRSFVSATGAEKIVRYHVVSVKRQPRSGGGSVSVEGVALESVEPYRWLQ